MSLTVKQTNAMGITTFDWAPAIYREAIKFWFYAIFASIWLSIYQIFSGVSTTNQTPQKALRADDDSHEKEHMPVQNAVADARSKIYIQLMIDCADLLVPGALLGWMPIDELYVGMAGTLSTVLAGRDIWNRLQ